MIRGEDVVIVSKREIHAIMRVLERMRKVADMTTVDLYNALQEEGLLELVDLDRHPTPLEERVDNLEGV